MMRIRELSTKLARLALLTVTLLGASACDRPSDGLPRSETLYMAGWQWGEPSSFNPLLATAAWPLNGGHNLLYETVLSYDPQKGQMAPLLADGFKQTDSSLEMTVNPAARWSDGKPVTGYDVKFSFDVGRTFKSLQVSPVWQYLSEIRLLDDAGNPMPDTPNDAPGYARRVEFVLNKDKLNPLTVMEVLQNTRIVPRHVLEPLIAKAGGNIDEFLKLNFEKNPVVSGPYQLKTYNTEKVVLERRDDYWGNQALHGGKRPGPKYVVHPLYKSNSAFSIALQQGRLDVSSTFVPRIWRKQPKGVGTWFDKTPYFLAASMPMLFINVKHGPLADVAYRRAMAFAVNYTDIRELAMSDYAEPLQGGLILPFGTESKYFSKEDVEKFGAKYDPAQAKKILAEAGYQSIYNEKGDLVETRKNGQRVPTMYIKSPTGWSDWEAIVRIAVRGMREAGIDARERFVDGNIFWNDIYAGEFDLIMFTPVGPPSPAQPWARFEFLLTSADFAPQGEKMYKNMGRFNDPKSPSYIARIDELLATIPSMKDPEQVAKAYRELNVLFMQQQPTIPLVYRPDNFYEFSTRHWKNFPTAQNPYLPPQSPGERMGTHMLWSLQKVPQ